MQTTGIPDAKALAGCAFQMQRDRLLVHPMITVDSGYLAR